MTYLKKFFSPILFLFTLFISNTWINLFINATNSEDFDKYYEYIKFYISSHDNLSYGQGVLYYFLVSLVYRRKIEFIDLENINYLLSSTVQNLNLYLYLFGLLGLILYFKVKKVPLSSIFFSLSFLNIFPIGMYMRSIMKPEILIFSLFTWVLYFAEKYFSSEKNKYIFYLIPFLTLIFNAKASTLGIVGIFLIFMIFQNKQTIKIKTFSIGLIMFTLCFVLIQYENYKITDSSFLNITEESEYQYTAGKNILFNINFLDIYYNPKLDFSYTEDIKSIHAESILNIVLMDSFGDHFRQFFDSNEQLSSQFRKKIFTDNSQINKRTFYYTGIFSIILINNLDHVRVYLSVFMALIFYALIFLNIYRDKEFRLTYSLPLIGIFILYLNGIGVPTQNYNPYTGDTFKAFYYSFVLVVVFTLLVLNLSKKYKKTFFIIFPIYVLMVFFIMGHPKSNSQYLSEKLITNNQFSIACELNNLIFFENEIIENIHTTGNINNTKSNCVLLNPEYKYSNTTLLENCKSDKRACRLYDTNNNIPLSLIEIFKIPIFSILNFLFVLFLSLNEIYKVYKLKNN